MTLGRLALGASIVAALAVYGMPARAADLGRGEAQDLEERVAELEATVAKRGNRKVSVVISGQVNKAILLTDEDLGSRQRGVIDNSASPTFVSIDGSAKFGDKNAWTAGYRIELGVDSTPAIPLLQDEISVRHSYAYVGTPVGKVVIGHTSMATDNITRITVANTDVAAPMLSLAPLSTAYFLGFDLPFSNLRRDLVRYDSPTLAGFILSASWANGDGPLSSIINSGFNPQHSYDVALRWAGEMKEGGGWRAAFGVGYRDENYVVNAAPISIIPFVRDRVYSGSASLMHMGSGIFISGAVAHVDGELLFGNVDYNAYHLQGGIEQRFFKIGKTTLYAEWAQLDIDGTSAKPNLMGAGLVQSIDAAALDLYATWRRIDGDMGGPEVDTAMAGVRIKF